MSEILKGGPMGNHHFAAVSVPYINDKNEQAVTQIIAIKDDKYNLVVARPGYEVYHAEYTGKAPRKRKANPNADLCYVANVLNFIFKDHWWEYKISKLTQVTCDMIFDAIDDYVETPIDADGERYRGQQCIDRYILAVSRFFANVAVTVPGCKVVESDLIKEETIIIKRSNGGERIKRVNVPVYKRESLSTEEGRLARDIPDKVVDEMIKQAEIHDRMLVFPIVCGETGGLRIGGMVNVRQPDSPVSNTPGIAFSYIGNRVVDIKIDLTHEYKLRSDNVHVGGLKKHKPVTIYKGFIPEFVHAYNNHMELLKQYPCEEEYKPMLIDSRGHAMTARTLRQRFDKLVTNHLIPALYASNDPVMVNYAQEITEKKLTPHILRHHFTLRLVEEKLSAENIASLRGDNNNMSAETYLRGKKGMQDHLEAVHSEILDQYVKGRDDDAEF